MNVLELIILIENTVKMALNTREVDNVVGIVDNTVQVGARTHNGEMRYFEIKVTEVKKEQTK